MGPSSVLLLLLSAANLQLGSSKARFAYDCENGYKHWRAAWDKPKQNWCCSYVERGCPGDSHSKEEFDCEDSINSWRLAWSDDKKGWCCEHRKTWSNSHQRFCCEIKRGCHLDESGTPFNCNKVSVKGVEVQWTNKESRWCCRNEPPKGCQIQQETTSEPFNCLAGLSRAQVGWSKRKQNWCCQHKDLGCPRQNEKDNRPGRYDQDCSKDFNNRRHWPKNKICHCCKHFGIACPPVYYPPNIPDHVVVCPNLRAQRKYDIAFNGTELAIDDYDPKSEASEAGPRRSADRSAAALAGGAALAAVRMGLRRVFRGGYAAMPEKPGESFLPVEEAEAESS